MTLDQLIEQAQALREAGTAGDALVVLDTEEEPLRLRALEPGEVYGEDVGNGVAALAWESWPGTWARKAVVLR